MAYRFDLNGSNALPAGNDQLLTFTAIRPTDISTWNSIQFILYDHAGGSALVTKSGVVTDPVNGVFTVGLLSADTSSKTPGKYWYAVRRIDGGANDLLAYGDFQLLASK